MSKILVELKNPKDNKQELLQVLAEQAPATLWATDKNLRITVSMGAGLKHLGVVPGQLVGTSLYDYLGTSDPGFYLVARHLDALKGISSNYEFEWNERTFHTQMDPCRGPDGTIIGTMAVSLDMTEHKHAEIALKKSLSQMRRLAARLQSIREEERRRIALEIHDRLGQTLTGLKWDLSSLSSSCRSTSPEEKKRLHRASHSLDDAIQIVREISTELRPAVLDSLGLKAAIEWQTREFEARTRIRCGLTLPLRDAPLKPEMSTAVFRIFQELLTNVARHARARRVETALSFTPTHLSLTVKDNGRGISRKALSDPGSFGLLGMRERAMAFGGTIDVQGKSNSGTVATVCLPLKRRKISRTKP